MASFAGVALKTHGKSFVKLEEERAQSLENNMFTEEQHYRTQT
jgi:hypothetical protein